MPTNETKKVHVLFYNFDPWNIESEATCCGAFSSKTLADSYRQEFLSRVAKASGITVDELIEETGDVETYEVELDPNKYFGY